MDPENGNGMHEPKPPVQPQHRHPTLANAVLSNSLPISDPLSPQSWPVYRKVITSLQAALFAFTVALGLTCFSAGKIPFAQDFGLTSPLTERFSAGFSLYLFGIAFAPYWSPHLAERIGRTIPYFCCLTINALFNIGVGFSHSVASALVCRFFAGFFGGPCLVLLEGTFADMWSAETTNTYYSFQGLAAYFGAGLGPLIGGYLVHASGGWRWTAWFPVCLAAFTLIFGVNMSETYQREIPRRHAKNYGKTRAQVIAEQEPAQSGTTLSAMFRTTVINPAVMFFTEPITTLVSIIMFFTWLMTFQWFIAVPVALGTPPPNGPGFSIQHIGLAFIGAPIGAAAAAITVITIEMITNAMNRKRKTTGTEEDTEDVLGDIEYRVIPAFLGAVWITIALFWVANTVNPNFKPIVPIAGTAFFVWGSAMVTFSIIPYTFDLFQPAGTLGTITTQAVGRILAAGFLPLLILLDLTALTPKWGFGLFGFISLAMWPIPIILFFFGAEWRKKSKYSILDM